MTADKQLDQRRMEHLATMKVAFAGGRYQEALDAFEQLAPLDGVRSGIRVEAIALAARAHLALGKKRAARDLLKLVWGASLKNDRLFRYVAIASLELGEYRHALSLVEKAIELSETKRAAG